MTPMTQLTQCNTSTNGNTRKNIRARIWAVTLNNPKEDDMTQWHRLLEDCVKYVWQIEEGKEGTEHIQGHIVFKSARTWKSLCNKLPRAHIEKVRNVKASEEYCQKMDTRKGEVHIKGFNKKIDLKQKLLEIEYSDVKWKPFQQKILDIIDGEVNKRTVYWFWGKKGNMGKSFLAKYICLKYGAIIASGKTGDIFNQLLSWRLANEDEVQLPVVIIDNPRSEYGHINYAAIEQLKNGFIYSGKYEGGQVFGLSPHVIIFANNEPEYKELSEDRLVVTNIEQNEDEISWDN